MSDIEVRPVVAAELSALNAQKPQPDGPTIEERLARCGEQWYFLAAWDSDKPLGIAVLDLSEGALAPELRGLWVYPDSRRRGAGRAMCQWIEDKARELGHRRIHLAVNPDNIQAIPLYIQLGYRPTGEHRPTDEMSVASDEHHLAIYAKSLLLGA